MSLNPLLQKNRPLIHPIIPGQPTVVGTSLPAPANSPRAVPDLWVPASVDISPALGGIGLGLVNPLTGLHVVVNPYVNMSSNDVIKVFFDDVQVHIHTVAIPNIAVDLHIPYGAFTPGTDKTVSIHYTVTRVGGAVEDSVPRLYRIKLTRPGGVDPSADPQHQNLVAPVLPPHIIANGVSEADAQVGFKVTIRAYPSMASFDVIDLRWNGVALPPRTVLPSEVGASIDIDITAAVIVQGGDGRDLMVFYRAYDQVNNVSEDSVGQPWSMITLVFVHANPNALPAPEVQEAPDGVLRLDQLGVNDVHVYVFPYPPVFVRGDRVAVRWQGQTSTGQPEAFEQTLAVGNVPGLLTFTVPNAKAAAIGGGYADVSYLLQDAAGTAPAKPSKYLRIDVIGQAVGEPWPAPLVRDATGASVTTLNPIKPSTSNQENTATLEVTDARLKVGNVLAGLWTVAGAQPLYVPWVTVSADGFVQAPVPREFIAAALGRTVVVEYVVFGDGGGEAIGTSVPMTLTVSAIEHSALPTPAIQAVVGSNLDLNTLLGDATVHIAPWPWIAQGQTLWLRAQGTADNDEAWSVELILAQGVTAAEVAAGVSRLIPRARLLRLKNSTQVTLELKVDFAGGTAEGTATLFPVGRYTVVTVTLDLREPQVPLVQDGLLDPDLVPPTGLPVTVSYGGIQALQEVELYLRGPNGEAHLIGPQKVGAGQTSLDFVVPKSELDRYGGQTLTLDYVVARVGGAQAAPSRGISFSYEQEWVERSYFGTDPGRDGVDGWVSESNTTVYTRPTFVRFVADSQNLSYSARKNKTVPAGSYNFECRYRYQYPDNGVFEVGEFRCSLPRTIGDSFAVVQADFQLQQPASNLRIISPGATFHPEIQVEYMLIRRV